MEWVASSEVKNIVTKNKDPIFFDRVIIYFFQSIALKKL